MRSEIQLSDQERPSFIEAARRAQITECAIEAIAELGFGQASLAQIARRAGVSTGVISYYFAGKDELIRAVVDHVYATGEAFVRPRLQIDAGARAALASFIEANVGFIAAHPKHPRAIMNIVRSGRGDSPALRRGRSDDEPRQAGVRAILEWGQREGAFRPFDLRVMAATIIEALDCITQRLAVEPDLDLDAYARELVGLFERAARSDDA